MTLTGTAFAEDAASCALAAGQRLDGRAGTALGCARSPGGIAHDRGEPFAGSDAVSEGRQAS